ncbi:MAG TPA: 50S ribosomal protein L15 [Ignavibacteriales bacterium]|nr:50S ribosomal protein L15 [Ignavibacteriales bacterium]HOL80161.1 50S ribosomal protein L15 [Ignavibacteriales bacterium]HOM64443.1 50S ribosomal protein L15 [Ignavibacteriales bacterium]HPD67930.1 50S ribosomal protein L15 [Ignavibacteriales bacterium]HPP32350.1 50S ribosomal protein L15 [Ignavibacteriales bacterium]
MDILSNLQYNPGSRKNNKRVGRGEGSGHGGQATRGMNGQKSRSGDRRKIGFEGGQMPLIRRVPKRGFKSPFRQVYLPVNLNRIEELVEKNITEITPEVLVENGILRKVNDLYKILGDGEIKGKVNIQAYKASKSAVEKVEKVGGTITIIED